MCVSVCACACLCACVRVSVCGYLSALALDALQLAPLLDGLREVHLTQRHLHLADLVVLGEAVEVEDGEHQRLVHRVRVRHALQRVRHTSVFIRSAARDRSSHVSRSVRSHGRPPPIAATHLEYESLVEDGVESFAMHFGLEFFLLIRQQVDFDVGVGGAAHVQSGQLLRLYHGHRQAVGVEVVFQL